MFSLLMFNSGSRHTLMKRIFSVLILFFLVACGGNSDVSPTVASTAEILPDAAASRPTPTAIPLTNTAPPQATASVADEPTEIASTVVPEAPTDQPTATPVPFNGKNEDCTFFRGRADAPVTFIDYSDFL